MELFNSNNIRKYCYFFYYCKTMTGLVQMGKQTPVVPETPSFVTSASFLAEIPLRSPRKLFIFII